MGCLGTLASSLVVLILVPVVFIVSDEIWGGASGAPEMAKPEFETELAGAALPRELQ